MKLDIGKALSETTVAIVCYNSASVIESCLAPLLGAHSIIVVDNASTDGSPDRIAEKFPNIKLVRNEKNLGYGTAMNQAMALVETPFALHLNPDAVFSPDALSRLHVAAHEGGSRTVICAPFLYSPKRGLELSIMGADERIHGPAMPVPEGPFCTWFISGTVWLIRVSAWREIGGFDENIFLYNDDFEFCRRATAQGYSIIVAPDAHGEHLVSQGTTPTMQIRWRKEWNIVWGHLYVIGKFEGRTAAHREASRLIRKHGPKTIFYAFVLQPKRFMRDLAVTHAAITFLSKKH